MKLISKKRGPAASLAAFKLTNEEWLDIHKNFWKLSRHQANSLLNMNTRGSHTDDKEDIEQEMCLSGVVAAMYHKRQCYIEECFRCLKDCVKDKAVMKVVDKLMSIWKPDIEIKDGIAPSPKDTPRQRFGQHQEMMLQKLVNSFVPSAIRPSVNTPFKFNDKFERYYKANTWNRIKTLGRKITKERPIRSGMASLSSFNYLVHSDGEPNEPDMISE